MLCPTRELADQVAGENASAGAFSAKYETFDVVRWSTVTVCSVIRCNMRRISWQRRVVLLDHLQKGTVFLDALNTLVMDEADRMLDMGFSDAIDDVIPLPASRQTLLFSATWPEAIAAISGRVQRDPLAIEIDSTDALPPIEQQFYETSSKGKIPLLQRLLSCISHPLVWCFAIPKKIARLSATR
ncbi:DEAD/DEAH box helicase [Escherichia coli]